MSNPLHNACRRGDINYVKYLEDKDIINNVDSCGLTPLMYALCLDKSTCMSEVIGQRVKLTDISKKTLELQKRKLEIVKIILQWNNIDLTITDKNKLNVMDRMFHRYCGIELSSIGGTEKIYREAHSLLFDRGVSVTKKMDCIYNSQFVKYIDHRILPDKKYIPVSVWSIKNHQRVVNYDPDFEKFSIMVLSVFGCYDDIIGDMFQFCMIKIIRKWNCTYIIYDQ